MNNMVNYDCGINIPLSPIHRFYLQYSNFSIFLIFAFPVSFEDYLPTVGKRIVQNMSVLL
jgi:hypothetical protein